MSDTLLLLHLVGGYFFLKKLDITSIYFSRLQGYHLIFASVLPATLLGILSLSMVKSLASNNVWIEYVGAGLISMLIGYLIPVFLNFFMKNQRIKITKASILSKDDPLEVLLLMSLLEEKSISITLKNHKVYVGIVTHLFNPSTPLKYIQILPILSGYRDPTTKRMFLPLNYTNSYLNILAEETDESNGIEDFQIIIAVSEIISANFFDYSIYLDYFAKEKQK